MTEYRVQIGTFDTKVDDVVFSDRALYLDKEKAFEHYYAIVAEMCYARIIAQDIVAYHIGANYR